MVFDFYHWLNFDLDVYVILVSYLFLCVDIIRYCWNEYNHQYESLAHRLRVGRMGQTSANGLEQFYKLKIILRENHNVGWTEDSSNVSLWDLSQMVD